MSNILYPPVDLRRHMHCERCARIGRPLLRRYGMPAHDMDWERHEQEGRYRLMGCCAEEGDAPYECRHCGEPTFVSAVPYKCAGDSSHRSLLN